MASRDPYWLTVKYAGQCKKCGVPIQRGAQAYYYPLTKALYCAGTCGQAADADFQSCAADEYAYNS